MIQKHTKGWKAGLEADMGFPVSEAYSLPMCAKSLMRSVSANGSHYRLQKSKVEASSQRVMIDNAFSVTECIRLAEKSHHSHHLL